MIFLFTALIIFYKSAFEFISTVNSMVMVTVIPIVETGDETSLGKSGFGVVDS